MPIITPNLDKPEQNTEECTIYKVQSTKYDLNLKLYIVLVDAYNRDVLQRKLNPTSTNLS